MNLEELGNNIGNRVLENLAMQIPTDMSDEYSGYNQIEAAKDFDYKEVETEAEKVAVKTFVNREITHNIIPFIFVLVFMAVFYFTLQNNGGISEADPVAVVMGICILAIFVISIISRPLVAVFLRKEIAEGVVVGKKISRTRTQRGTKRRYKAFVVNHYSRKICRKVSVSQTEYNKLQNGDKIYIVRSGYIYMGIKAEI